jgi:AraC-like DNA-binding protein
VGCLRSSRSASAATARAAGWKIQFATRSARLRRLLPGATSSSPSSRRSCSSRRCGATSSFFRPTRPAGWPEHAILRWAKRWRFCIGSRRPRGRLPSWPGASAFRDRCWLSASAISWESHRSLMTRWRLQLGTQFLTSTSRSVAEIAVTVGYESEAAFNRAFKREYGRPPARFRTKSQSAAAAD